VFLYVSCVDPLYKFLKRPTNALEFTNVSLLHRNHRHVAATHVTILRVARTRI